MFFVYLWGFGMFGVFSFFLLVFLVSECFLLCGKRMVKLGLIVGF